ncbi:MAG: inverse autotransporter beta domain-containing protein, partial [Candidatus Saccharimonas sp.]|nr:inverse autotransporter beta domain-containing protein [Planctomycetaceae bacterium]
MQRVKISLLCLLSLSFAGVLAAQTAVDPNSDAGSASLQDFSGGATLRGTYFDVRHMSGDGVGYKNGYTQIGAFTPFWLSEDAFIAPNARLLLTDNSGIGLNAGLVARRYDSGRDRIWGINGYFDTDETKFGNRYNQLGVGFETLGQFFDFRANAYAPTGEDTTFIRPVGLSGTPFFFENRIGLIGTQLMEQALSGGDFEAGVPVSPQTPWLRAFGGAYAYQQNLGDDPVGFRGRLEAWISDDLSLGVTATWDKQFDTNVNFVADWRFSGFKPTRYFPQWTTRERMLMPVQRQWRITAGNYNEDVNILAFNPRDNQPYFVVWYDNSAGGLNDGTFENPYNTTLTHAIPNETDLVLVRRGNTTQAAPLNGSITLPNFARMLGEGKAHIFDAYGDFGPFHVAINDQVLPDPAFTDPARANRYPFLTNADAGLNGGDIIRVGSNNEVSALVLEDATGRAIFGNNVQGFHFNNLEITNNIGGGIVLQDASGFGPVTLDGQTITGAVLRDINTNPVVGWSFVGTGLGDNAAGGIDIDTLGGLALTVTNVAMNSNPSAQLFGIRLLADDGPLTTTFTDVNTDGFAPGFGNTTAGIIIGETGETVNATFNNVSASNNTGIGMQVTGTGGIIHLFSDSLTANANGLDNLQIGSQGAPLVGTTFLGTFSDSFFNDSLAGSGIVYSQSGGTGTLNLTNIQANSNGVDGLGMFGAAASVMNVNVQDSSLTVNTRDAFHVEQIGGSTINLLVNTADGSVSGRDGLFFNLASGSRLNATFLNDNLSNSGRSAVHGEMDASTLVLDFNTTTGDLSGEHGLFLDAVNGSNALMFITDGTFVDSSQNAANTFDGIHISSDASFVGLTMRNTPSNNTPALPLGTQRHGMFLDIQNGSTFGGLVADGNLTNSR